MFDRLDPIVEWVKRWPFQLALAAFTVSGLIYLASKVLWGYNSGLDFRLIWLAGKQWANGENPYGLEFFSRYLQVFGPGPNSSIWFYPPYWWPLAVPFSFLPFPTSYAVWRLFNLAMLIGATYLTSRSSANILRQKWLPIFCIGLGYVCLMQATAITLALGQTSIVVYLGISLLCSGLLEKRPRLLIAAIVCLALKPNIGIVCAAAILALPQYRWTLIPACAICAAALMPVLISTGPQEMISTFLSILSHYNDVTFRVNRPPNMTGLVQFIDFFVHYSVSSAVLMTMAIIVGPIVLYLSFCGAGQVCDNTQSKVQTAGFGLFLALTFFLLPLHTYDLVPIALLLITNVANRLPGWQIVAAGLLLCVRAGNFASVSSIANPASGVFPSSLLNSCALLLILLGSIWSFVSVLRLRGPAEVRTPSRT